MGKVTRTNLGFGDRICFKRAVTRDRVITLNRQGDLNISETRQLQGGITIACN